MVIYLKVKLHYNARNQAGTGWDSYTANDIIGMAVDYGKYEIILS